jgi:hypothetical protein
MNVVDSIIIIWLLLFSFLIIDAAFDVEREKEYIRCVERLETKIGECAKIYWGIDEKRN